MSNGLAVLAPQEGDVTKMVMAGTHLGMKNCNFQMQNYVFKRRPDGIHVLNIHKTWEKVVLAARIIAAIENPKDVCVISGCKAGQRAVLKFASMVGATAMAGRYTPGTFTNQIQKRFTECRLLIVTDPQVDHQPVREASYVNMPTIAICDTDTPLRYIDVAIPANNKSVHSVGLIWWLLAREVLRLRGTLQRDAEWEVMPDLFFYRDPEDAEKEEQEAAAAAAEAATVAAPTSAFQQWEGGATTATEDAATAASFAAPAASEEWGAPAAQDWTSGATKTPSWDPSNQ